MLCLFLTLLIIWQCWIWCSLSCVLFDSGDLCALYFTIAIFSTEAVIFTARQHTDARRRDVQLIAVMSVRHVPAGILSKPLNIANCTQAFEWCQFQWPWVTCNFKVTNYSTPSNSKMVRHTYSGRPVSRI